MAENTFFSHGTFTRIDHVQHHKTQFNKSERVATIPCMCSDHKGIKLVDNKKDYHQKYRLNITLLNNMRKKISRNLKIFEPMKI